MDLILLTKTILSKIIENSETVLVSEEKLDDETIITILANEDVMGRIIGKNGKMINAIRTIVQASGYINGINKVKVNVDTKNEQ